MEIERFNLYENGMEQDADGQWVRWDDVVAQYPGYLNVRLPARIIEDDGEITIGFGEARTSLTDAEAAATIEQIDRENDSENRHRLGDELLCSALIHHGWIKTVAAWKKMKKWYA